MRQLIQGSVRPVLTPRKAKWAVYLGRKEISQVYFDPKMTAEEVRNSLVNHDGIAPNIRVFRVDIPGN